MCAAQVCPSSPDPCPTGALCLPAAPPASPHRGSSAHTQVASICQAWQCHPVPGALPKLCRDCLVDFLVPLGNDIGFHLHPVPATLALGSGTQNRCDEVLLGHICQLEKLGQKFSWPGLSAAVQGCGPVRGSGPGTYPAAQGGSGVQFWHHAGLSVVLYWAIAGPGCPAQGQRQGARGRSYKHWGSFGSLSSAERLRTTGI